jgi:spore coat protein CotH
MNTKFVIIAFLLTGSVQIGFSQNEGNSLFNSTAIHTIQLTFLQGNYWNLLTAGKAFDDANDTSTYIPASVTIDGTALDSVGIQLKGNSSYYNYPGTKKPFTLSFDEYISSQRYDGLKNINLNNGYQDPTLMREKLFLDFLNEQGLYAPRANYARLYINGIYWGLYLMVERVDKNFVKNRVGNKQGNLFKGDGVSASCATLQYHVTMSSYYDCYTLKTNTATNNWSDLVNLTYEIYATDSTEFKDSIEVLLNTVSFIGAFAACNLFVNFDSYAYRFPHNYYLYHNTATDKFDWITWDASTAFGMDVPATVSQIENYSVLYTTPPHNRHPLAMRMLENSFYKTQYLNTICRFTNNYFRPPRLNPIIDSIASLIRKDYFADNLKMYSNQNFDDNINGAVNINGRDIPGLKSFIANRSLAVQNELSGLAVSCTTTAPVINCDSFCVLSIAYDTANDNNLYVVILNNDTTFINYPIVQLIDANGDTVANKQGIFEFYGQSPGTTQTYHIPTLLDSFPSNWIGQVRIVDGLYGNACLIDYPCGRIATGIRDVQSNFTFKVFPNPAQNTFGLLSTDELAGSEIIVANIIGQPILTQIATSSNQQINISSFPSGLYLIKVKKGNTTFIRKLIVGSK